jgi:hypothetical protein
MNNNFLIAVGGSGQMIALAYFRLARLCGFKEPAHLYIMDSDFVGDNDVTKMLDKLLGKKRISTIKPIPQDINYNSFSDIFHNNENAQFDEKIDNVLGLLFTQEELNTNIEKGMYGKPPVGSTCLNVKIDNIEMNENALNATAKDPLIKLVNDISRSKNSKVVICGSLFGGTGAGGVPTLAKYIREKVGLDVEITIIDLMRWFHLSQDQKVSEEARLRYNEESGIFYLKDKIANYVDACVLLGPKTTTERTHQEVGAQTEKPNYINLFAAVIASNTFNITAITDLFAVQNSIYCYATPVGNLKASDIDVILPTENNTVEYKVKLNEIIQLAMATNEFLGFFANYIYEGSIPGFSFFPSLTVPSNLKRAEKRLGTDALKKIYDAVKQRKDDYIEILDWFEELTEDGSFETNENEITTNAYKKTSKSPMPFLRQWISKIEVDSFGERVNTAEEFVDQMIKKLRLMINSKFIEERFGKMEFM